jgi:ABC-type glycerol-3-phosphate transport system permease component
MVVETERKTYMTLAFIIINSVFVVGIVAAIIAPIVWAIVTQHRDEVVLATQGRRQVRVRAARRRRRSLYEPIVWPAR